MGQEGNAARMPKLAGEGAATRVQRPKECLGARERLLARRTLKLHMSVALKASPLRFVPVHPRQDLRSAETLSLVRLM